MIIILTKLSILDNDGRHDTCVGFGAACNECNLSETGGNFYKKPPSPKMCRTLLNIPVGTRGLYELYLDKQHIALALYTSTDGDIDKKTPKDVKMFREFYEQRDIKDVCLMGIGALSLYRQVMFRVKQRSVLKRFSEDMGNFMKNQMEVIEKGCIN